MHSFLSQMWRVVARIQSCVSLNHCKTMKVERSRWIPRKLTENRELLIVICD